MSTGVCRECGADIIWAWTETGKRMPLDEPRYPREDTTANVAVRTDHTGRIWARVISKDRPLAAFEHRGMPHFATCPARKPADELAAARRRHRRTGDRRWAQSRRSPS